MDLNTLPAVSGPLTPDTQPIIWKQVQDWLTRYGYVAKGVQLTPEDMRAALQAAQNFGQIPPTGEYDEATKTLFTSERCGNPHLQAPTAGPAGPPQSRPWSGSIRDHTGLTWAMADLSRHKSEDECRNAIREAFYIWMAVSPFTFWEDTSGAAVDILFRWGQGSHHLNCPAEYDFLPNMSAHTTPLVAGRNPVTTRDMYYGQIHFADDKVRSWSNEKLRGVAVHEIGHAIGLGDTYVGRAWMNSRYEENIPLDLHYDDISGLRALYHGSSSRTSLDPIQPQLCATDVDLFQLLPNGLIYQRIRDDPNRNGWTLIDDNWRNGQLASCGGKLYLRHHQGDRRIYRYTGTPRKWERVAEFPDASYIAATANHLFVYRCDQQRPVWRYQGSGKDWVPVDSEQLLDLHFSHEIACSPDDMTARFFAWTYAEGRVYMVSDADKPNPKVEELWAPNKDEEMAVKVVFANPSLYILQRNTMVMALDDIAARPHSWRWVKGDIDTAGGVDIACVSGILFWRRADGTVWRFDGYDENGDTVLNFVDVKVPVLSVARMSRSGAWFIVQQGGQIWGALT